MLLHLDIVVFCSAILYKSNIVIFNYSVIHKDFETLVLHFNVAFSQRSTICLPALCHVFAATGTEIQFINAAETMLNVKSHDLKLLFILIIF